MINKIVEEDLKHITNQKIEWKKFKNKTVLITGATGFIGGYFVDTFMYLNKVYDYNIKVIIVVRDYEKVKSIFSDIFYNGLNIRIYVDISDIKYVYGDIHYIIHCASIATPKLFENNPVDVILPNVIGTKNLLDLAVEKKSEFLFFSTSGVNFEFNHLDLASCYLESKRMGENLCIAYAKQYNVPVKIVRPSIIFGPRIKLDDGRSYADFVRSIVNKENIVLTSDGQAYRNYLYISDAMRAFFIVMLEGENNKPYNVACEFPFQIKRLADLLVCKVFPELNLKVDTNINNKYLRSEFKDTTVSIKDIESLGWTQTILVLDGFKRTVESFK